MYQAYFKLSKKPFLLNTDPRFLWLGSEHQEALATLSYGVQENKGLLLLTGDIGTGKTTLISALVDRLDGDDDIVVAKMPDPGLSRKEFFFLTACSFGIQQCVHDKETFTQEIGRFLELIHKQGKKALLIIDEAQIMSTEILEEVRLLSNLEYRNTRLLNIFLSGQNELNQLLQEPQNRAIRDRITISYNLPPLSEAETKAYITHRLRVAGAETTIFTDDAVREIHTLSNGSPRQINILCDLALVFGFEENATQIDIRTIAECKTRTCIPNVLGPPLPGKYPLPETLEMEETGFDHPAAHGPASAAPPMPAVPDKPINRIMLHILLALLISLPICYLLYNAVLKLELSPAKTSASYKIPAPEMQPTREVAISLAPLPQLPSGVVSPSSSPKKAEANRAMKMPANKKAEIGPPANPAKTVEADRPPETLKQAAESITATRPGPERWPPAQKTVGGVRPDENRPAAPPAPINDPENLHPASSKTPDPADIIDWLLEDGRKKGSPKSP